MRLLAYLLLVFASVFASLGQTYMKRISRIFDKLTPGELFSNISVYLALGFYLCYFSLSTLAYQYEDYGKLFSVSSLSYIWVLFLAHWFFRESITPQKSLGILIIVIGIAMVVIR